MTRHDAYASILAVGIMTGLFFASIHEAVCPVFHPKPVTVKRVCPPVVPTEVQGPPKPSLRAALETAYPWGGLIYDESRRYGVDPILAVSVMQAESGGQIYAKSTAGALGLMQLMPGTARWMGVSDPFDPKQNIRGGVKFLAYLRLRYETDLERRLAAYNAGEGVVDAAGGIPNYRETKAYVRHVVRTYERNQKRFEGAE